MTAKTLSEVVDMRIRKAMLMHMDCRVGHIEALLEIRAVLVPLLDAAEDMRDHVCRLGVTDNSDYDQARAVLMGDA